MKQILLILMNKGITRVTQPRVLREVTQWGSL